MSSTLKQFRTLAHRRKTPVAKRPAGYVSNNARSLERDRLKARQKNTARDPLDLL
jgi:hypothetical protein